MTEIIMALQIVVAGITLALMGTILLCLIKVRKGIDITVNIHPQKDTEFIQSPVALPDKADLEKLQQTLDKNEEVRQDTAASLDSLIGQLNEIMTGGTEDGRNS